MNELHEYLMEDTGKTGDITSDALFTNEDASAEIISKEECVLAGLEEVEQLLIEKKCNVNTKANDGDLLPKNKVILQMEGQAKTLLLLERLILNIVGRMSGIATETHNLVSQCKKINNKVSIAATRKTTPGFRKFEKKAVEIGGGEPHRLGLFDAIIIKDNHLAITGSIDIAISRARQKHPTIPVEVEVDNYDDAITASKLHVDVIMLDNFPAKQAQEIAYKIREIYPKIFIECSGGITAENIEDYAIFADRISLGYITHSVRSKDFSMQII
jgi:nicotinate-nucleotide pyrophosphorylase (carboxylating)